MPGIRRSTGILFRTALALAAGLALCWTAGVAIGQRVQTTMIERTLRSAIHATQSEQAVQASSAFLRRLVFGILGSLAPSAGLDSISVAICSEGGLLAVSPLLPETMGQTQLCGPEETKHAFPIPLLEPPVVARVRYRFTLLEPWGLFFGVLFSSSFAALGWLAGRRRREREIRARIRSELATAAAQVAHDIRSPLTALEMFAAQACALPEESRVLMRGAINRMRDIANDLLARHRATPGGLAMDEAQAIPPVTSQAEPVLVSVLLDCLVTEKRVQFRSRSDIEISLEIEDAAYCVFALAPSADLKRAVSNLLNNAVEAIPAGKPGSVRVSARQTDQSLVIRVADSGQGIPAEVLSRLGRVGETHGKEGGSGLGLAHAKRTAQACGGELSIDSVAGKGTSVSVRLPICLPPAWFASRLPVPKDAVIAILDDDLSIHQVWKGRLAALSEGSDRPREILHFTSASELTRWVSANHPDRGSFLLLTDQELLGQAETGLDLIGRLGFQGCAILVTSHFEDPKVIRSCESMNVRLLPKPFAPKVPIRIQASRIRWDAVLIDDDPLVHSVWRMNASSLGKSLLVFSAPEELFARVDAIDPSSVIFVDSNLGKRKGEEVSRELADLGFREIYLTTGYEAASFGAMPWLRGIIGKEPPWVQQRGALRKN